MKIEPLHDNVVVKPLDEEKVTNSGIILPDNYMGEKPAIGEVLSTGKLVGKGDKVVFSKYSPIEVEVDDEKYLLIEEKDILAKITD